MDAGRRYRYRILRAQPISTFRNFERCFRINRQFWQLTSPILTTVSSQDFGFEAEDTRDRLFEILMSRFEALTPHRMAVGAFSRDLHSDPIGAICLFPTALTSMTWMLEAAGILSSGPFGLLRAKGLLAVWLTTERVWLTMLVLTLVQQWRR